MNDDLIILNVRIHIINDIPPISRMASSFWASLKQFEELQVLIDAWMKLISF